MHKYYIIKIYSLFPTKNIQLLFKHGFLSKTMLNCSQLIKHSATNCCTEANLYLADNVTSTLSLEDVAQVLPLLITF